MDKTSGTSGLNPSSAAHGESGDMKTAKSSAYTYFSYIPWELVFLFILCAAIILFPIMDCRECSGKGSVESDNLLDYLGQLFFGATCEKPCSGCEATGKVSFLRWYIQGQAQKMFEEYRKGLRKGM